jgi:glucose/arabinose dehydrogenase
MQVESIPTVNDTELRIETVFEGLNFPTNMEFLGYDDIIVIEKNNGTVLRITNGTATEILDINVATRAERGLLGIAVSNEGKPTGTDEDLATYIYLFFTRFGEEKDSDGERGEKSLGNSLVRYELNGSKLIDPKMMLGWLPAKGPAHNGGAILVGPNNTLYVPVGDGDQHSTLAQNIVDGLRPDGTGGILTVPLDSLLNITSSMENHFKYYAYGIRNSFGIDFDPLSGKLWDTENGLNDNDEINIVEQGFNSGWSKVQGKAPANFSYSQLVNLAQGTKYSDPEFTWSETVGPTKIKFLNSDKLGVEYQNDIFVGDIRYGRIYHFDLNESRDQLILSHELVDKVANTDQETKGIIFGSGFGGITDIDVGPDGYLYILSFGKGKIYRVIPQTEMKISTESNNTFNLPHIGFEIDLPKGWRGVDNENMALFSPHGISPRTGAFSDEGENVMMTIELVNSSLLFGGMKQYLEEYQKGSCTILSNNFIQINNLSTQEVFKQCGPLSEEKVMNYIFASGKSIIFVSLKGTGEEFDKNLFNFRDSISTIKMKNTSDIKQFT